jgi:hypothetical protein
MIAQPRKRAEPLVAEAGAVQYEQSLQRLIKEGDRGQ